MKPKQWCPAPQELDFDGPVDRRALAILLLLLVLAAIHILTVWGHVGLFWGDPGLWPHQVERFAQGELPYRDWDHEYPPLWVWLMGGYARLFGTQLPALWTFTSATFVGVLLLYFVYSMRLAGRTFLPLTVIAGAILAIGYGQATAAPLPMGSYSPAVAIGFGLTLAAVIAGLEAYRSRRWFYSCLAGACCGLAFLTKQDFWPSSGLIVAAVCLGLWITNGRAVGQALLTLGAFLGTVGAGVLLVVLQTDLSTLAGVIRVYGATADITVGRMLPSWERIVAQLTAAATIATITGASLVVGGAFPIRQAWKIIGALGLLAIAGVGIYAAVTFAIARETAPPGSEWALVQLAQWEFREAFVRHLVPPLLPAGLLLAVLLRWQRLAPAELKWLLLALLLLALTLRVKRGFESVVWYNLVLELPIYVLALRLFIGKRVLSVPQSVNLALLAVTVLGVYAWYHLGVGPFTRGGVLERVETTRGVVYLSASLAEDYRYLSEAVARLDPAGQRPLFAYGYSGGFNYFLARRNPTPVIVGLFFSTASPEAVVERVLAPSPGTILIENPFFDNTPIAAKVVDFTRWNLTNQPNYYRDSDRPVFNQLLDRCSPIPDQPPIAFSVYVCD